MMNLTKVEKGIQKAVREFARGEFDREGLMAMAKGGEFPVELLRRAADVGLIGAHLPEEYGGGGLGMAVQAVILEELAAQDSTAACAIASATFGVEMIDRFGSPDMKESVLPLLTGGQGICTTAFFEQDVQAREIDLATTATREENGWRLDGAKCHVLNAERADFFVVLCRTSQNGNCGDATLLMVEKGKPGVTVQGEGARLGMGMVSSATVTFQGVEVPGSRTIGAEGKGWECLEAFRCAHWILLAALSMGTAMGAYRRALEYIWQRRQFGKRVGEFRVSRKKVADMASGLELAGLATRRAALLYDDGNGRTEASALARRCASETAVAVAGEAVQLLGGYGYMVEYDVEHYLRDAKALELLGGEKSLLWEVIADDHMGKASRRAGRRA